MTYQHFEPPVASVTLDAYEVPIKMAEQILIAGWNRNYTHVMNFISALDVYRDCAYGEDSSYPGQSATVESVMNFIYKHPIGRRVDKDSKDTRYGLPGNSKQLCIKLLDHMKFFNGLEECVGISDDKPSTDV